MMRWIGTVHFLVCFIILCVVLREGSCCQRGWLQHGDYCFRIGTKPLRRIIARVKCLLEGSELTSIPNESVLQYLNAQLGESRGDGFWVGLQYDPDEGKLLWLDGTPATEEPWIKPYSEGKSLFTSARMDCFAYNGTLIAKVSCSERLGYICGHKRANNTTRTVCNSRVDPEHSFIGEETGRCLFRAQGKTTKDNVEELCALHQGHFVDLDDMIKDGMTAFYDHKVLANDGSKYWTGLTWNGTNIIWNNSLPEDLNILFVNGTGSCITVQFNFTEVLEAHLYQTNCYSEAQVVCSKTEDASEDSMTTEVLLNDAEPLSCPHGDNWKEDKQTDDCYWIKGQSIST